MSPDLTRVRMTRRTWLTAAVTSAAMSAVARAAAAPPTGIIDTHTHFYDPTRPEGVPWPAKGDAFLYRSVLPAEYRAISEPLGVVGTVVVEASPWVEDNQWVLTLCDRNPFLKGLVGNLLPGTPEFAGHLERFTKHPKFLGIRVNQGPLSEGLPRAEFLADLRRLGDTGRELDVNGGPALLPLVDKLATSLPELRIVINHLANVRIDGANVPADWRRDIELVARHPQVRMKVSALVEGASQGERKAPSDVAFYKPTLDVVWRAFGDDRVIYGSNWPVSARFADYKTVQSLVTDYVADRGAEAVRKFFSANAKLAYRWPE